MDSLLEKIKTSFKWKKTSDYCADKLGMTVEDYDILKDMVKARLLQESGSLSYEYNLEKGEAKRTQLYLPTPRADVRTIQQNSYSTCYTL